MFDGTALTNMLSLEKERIVLKEFGEPFITHRKKGNKIIEYYRVEMKQPELGTRLTITCSTREGLIEKLWKIHKGEGARRINVEDVFWEYYQYRAADKSISSMTAEYDLSNWKRFFQGKNIAQLQIGCVKSSDVLQCYKDIVGRAEITRKAFMKARGLLIAVFDEAVEKNYIHSNIARDTPINKLRFLPAKDNSEKVFTKEERRKLLDYLGSFEKKTVYSLGVQLAANFIARIGEIRAFTWDDYNENDGTMMIWHEIVKVAKDGKKRVDQDVPYTKGYNSCGQRIVKVSNEAKKILEELRKINGNKKYILNGTGDAQFSISENRFNEHLKEYCEAAGIPYFSSHKFRFYGITAMYDAGVDEAVIRYNAGHSTADMTRKYRRSKKRQLTDGQINTIFD